MTKMKLFFIILILIVLAVAIYFLVPKNNNITQRQIDDNSGSGVTDQLEIFLGADDVDDIYSAIDSYKQSGTLPAGKDVTPANEDERPLTAEEIAQGDDGGETDFDASFQVIKTNLLNSSTIDSDGDGFNDIAEYTVDTDLNVTTSVFDFDNAVRNFIRSYLLKK